MALTLHRRNTHYQHKNILKTEPFRNLYFHHRVILHLDSLSICTYRSWR